MIKKEVEPAGLIGLLLLGLRETGGAQNNDRFLVPGNDTSQLRLTKET